MHAQRDEAMIDLETFGTKDNCKIAEIGAVIFNRDDPMGFYGKTFCVKVELENQPNRYVEPGALKWWQSEEMAPAYAALMSGPKVRLGVALKQLADFLHENGVKYAWACSPSFDMKILQHAYNQHKQDFPIPFWNWEDVRTIERWVFGKNTRKPGGLHHIGGLAHSALDDCYMQVNCVQNARKVTK